MVLIEPESIFQMIRTPEFHQIRTNFMRTLRRCAASFVVCLATSMLLSKSLIPILDFEMIFCFSIALSASFRSRSDKKRSDFWRIISTERDEEIGGTSSSELNTFVKPRSLNIDVCDVAIMKRRRFCGANQQELQASGKVIPWVAAAGVMPAMFAKSDLRTWRTWEPIR